MPEYILLINEKDYLLIRKGRRMNTKYGIIDARKLEAGDVVDTKGGKFIAVEPTFIDLLKKCRRGAQIVTPKDASQIVAITGISEGWKCLDAGSGSGFLAIFMANVVGRRGRVVTYEIRREFFEIAKKNIEMSGLKNIRIKNEDVFKFRERNLDIITLDLKNAHQLVAKARKRLKAGGWLVVYSPHVEEQIRVIEEMRKNKFYVHTTIETIQRRWESMYGYTHPVHSGLLHTGFMTFGRRTF